MIFLRYLFIFILFSSSLLLTSCNPESKEKADLILLNAKVYTVDQFFSEAGAFAVKDGKFIAVGSSAEIQGKYAATEVLDAKGAAVYPGLYDGHAHFVGLGDKLATADLIGTTSWEDVVNRVGEFAKQHPEVQWIRGRGWDQNDWEVKEFPTNEKLTQLLPDKPILLTRVDGHAAIANKQALALAGINSVTKVQGGKVMLKDGKVTGVLIDKAMDLVEDAIPEPSKEELERQLLMAQDTCLSYGLTTVVDAGLTRKKIEAINSLQEEGKLKVRIYAMIDPKSKDYFFKNGAIKTDRLNVRSFKIYADGALGSRGAVLIHPYHDDPGNRGLLLSDPEELKSLMQAAHNNGFQVNTHCIGDSANRLVLDLYGEILGEDNGFRWRIEHAQIVDSSDIAKYKKFRVIPSVQPTHATSDMYWADERLGPDRVKQAYAFKELMEQNDIVVFGTDFPVEAVSPFYTFHSAVARKDAKGFPEDGFQMENSVSREEALKAMTIWPAFSCFEESEKGSIEIGKLADFVILDRDLMTISEPEMRDAKVLKSYIGGELVYEKTQ